MTVSTQPPDDTRQRLARAARVLHDAADMVDHATRAAQTLSPRRSQP